MSSISDAPSLRPVTLRAYTCLSAPCRRDIVSLSEKTYTRYASQDETDAAEDDDSDEREADLPRDEGNLIRAQLHGRKERQRVG